MSYTIKQPEIPMTDGVIDIEQISPEASETKTNGDMLRSMDDGDLALWICNHMTAECCNRSCPAREICSPGHNGLQAWIRQPAKEREKK